ncbi:MAG TPA: FliH/SctL family protein [bacterium]|nr:FliH/SctL family protein [bacterium]
MNQDKKPMGVRGKAGFPSTQKVIKRVQFDPEFRPVNIAPIIKGRVMTAYEEAKGIVTRARQEGTRIRREAKATLEQAVVEKGAERERGYNQGLQEGLAQLSEKILETELAREKILGDAEPQIIQMVMDIAEKVIGREVEKGAIVDVVKQAISQAVGKKITVRINPLDVPFMREREKELFQVIDQTQSVNIKEDEQIPPGGCVVETEMGAVDARLETQITAIRKALGL